MTARNGVTDNPLVSRVVGAATRLVVALALLIAPMLAPEHVHETDAHHHDAIVHRHIAMHDHDGATIGDHDGAVVWLTEIGALAKAAESAAPVTQISPFTLAPPTARGDVRHQNTPEAAHGPPRTALVPRAPPPSV